MTKKIGSAVIGDDEEDDHGDKFQIEAELVEQRTTYWSKALKFFQNNTAHIEIAKQDGILE